jgi:hypothetical protein
MITELESLIDSTGMRGAPGSAIRAARDEMKGRGPWPFDLLAGLLADEQIEALSREAWEFLFGK